MIACYAAHDRASMLFSALHSLDPRFVDLGVIKPARKATLLAKLQSASWNRREMGADTGFAPAMLEGLESAGSAKLTGHSGVEHVLCWGAKTFPFDLARDKYPYSLITDMCFDPEDERIPEEWRPYRHRKFYSRRHAEVLGRAAHIFTLSAWARNQICYTYGIEPAKVLDIGCGPIHKPQDRRLDQRAYFLMVGNDWHRKGVPTIKAATVRLRRKYPDVVTVLVGRPGGGFQWKHKASGDTYDSIMSQVDQRGSRSVVEIPHAVSGEIAMQLIANATALVLASSFEPRGHVVDEAHSMGTPVIGSTACGLPEGVNTPMGGLTFTAGDANALAAAMEEVWIGDRNEMRQNARQQYQRAGGWEESARRIQNALATP